MARVRLAPKAHTEPKQEGSDLAANQSEDAHPAGLGGGCRETGLSGDFKMRNLSFSASKIRQQLSSYSWH